MGVWVAKQWQGWRGCRRQRTMGKRGLPYLIFATLLLTTACAVPPVMPPDAGTTPLLVAGDPERGWQALQTYGCHACHTIPGVPGANTHVGPPLTAWAERGYIAGMLPNTPENLFSFVQYPQAFRPGGAMPDLGVTPEDARNISAYLYTLRDDRWWHWVAVNR